MQTLLNALALAIGFIGTLILFKFGLPSIDVLNSGGYVEMSETDDIRRYKAFSKIGIALIAAGFLLQFVALFVDTD